MRRTTAILNQWKAETQSGESLQFEVCKGGYFSDQEEYGLKVVGKTDQKTLTGKNLFNGVLQGGYYGDADFGVVGSTNPKFVSSNIFLKKGTYTLSASVPLVYVRLIVNGVYYPVGSKTFTNEADGMIGFSIRRADDTNWDYEGTMIQIEEGTAATSIEPYCGGVPSPNPDHPQEIQCVKAGTKVKVCGKNLLNCKEYESEIHISKIISQNPNAAAFPSAFKQNTIYTITFDCEISENNTNVDVFGVRVDYIDGTTEWLYPTVNNAAVSTNGKSISSIKWSYNNNFAFAYFKAQLEPGETFTGYEPYISGGEITTPCDLYEGDLWWPMTGRVERHKAVITLTGDEEYYNRTSNQYFTGTSTNQYTMHDAIKGEYHKPADYYCSVASHVNFSWATDRLGGSVNNNQLHLRIPNVYIGVTDEATNDEKAEAYISFVRRMYENGTPICFCVPRSAPEIEQYAPQRIFAPRGTVNAVQEPVDLSADLSATMLARR